LGDRRSWSAAETGFALLTWKLMNPGDDPEGQERIDKIITYNEFGKE